MGIPLGLSLNLNEIPKTDFSNWCSNEIDFFIANKLESKGLKPAISET